jgi:hypothetical protein
MPSLLRPRIWTSQPQVPVDIDWSNSLTRGLSGFYMPNNEGVFSITGTPTIQHRETGRVLRSNGNNFSRYRTSRPSQTGTGQVSVLWSGSFLGTPSGSSCIGGLTHNSTNAAPYVFCELKRRAGSSDTIYLNSNVGGLDRQLLSPVTTYTTGDFTIVGTVKDGEQVLYIKNGRATTELVAQAAQAGAVTAGATSRFEIGESLNATRNPNSDCAIMLTWNRVLTPVEAKSVGNNPWQIFAPLVT